MHITPQLRIRFYRYMIWGAFLSLTVGHPFAQASNYFARFTLGSYVSDESYSAVNADGTSRNSFATVSSRSYIHYTETNSTPYDFIGDVRDTHDFFDKLDAERLELTPQNRLQLKQLNVNVPILNGGNFVNLGRFAVPESGTIYVDGALAGHRFDSASSVAIFGGYNPQRVDQTYAQWNSDSQNAGIYYLFQPRYDSWYDSLVGSSAIVAEQVQNHLDRLYVYGNYYRQWRSRNSVIAMGYFDFVPRAKIQTAYLSHGRALVPNWFGTGTLTAIDVIEYSRRRGVLERLAPSNYQEAALAFEQKNSVNFILKYNLAYGIRSYDHLNRIEGSSGFALSNFWSKYFTFQMLGGYRKNFTSTDEFVRSTLNYSSRNWEGSLDLEYDLRHQTDHSYKHPLTEELSYANYLSKALYGAISGQYAANEDVKIISAFFKLGYRLGSEDVAPLRDGTPPVGGRL